MTMFVFLPEEAATNLHQIDIIDDTLTQLTERKAELQKSHDNILDAKDMNKGKKSTLLQIYLKQILHRTLVL